ncbi:MAG: hypothetical protein ACTHMI_16615 [Mucilaginibacter sp.]
MLKRSLHIVLAAWLINALVCFHPVFSEVPNAHASSCETTISHPDNTLLEIIYNHVFDAKQQKGHGSHHAAPKYRYVVSRNLGLDVCGEQVPGFSLYTPETVLPPFVHKIWENRIFLPPHHHFLFRLSPF